MIDLGGYPMNTVQPKSWFGFLGSVVLGITFAMTACGGDDGDDDGTGGSSNGGASNGGASNGGTSNGGTTTAGAPAQSTPGNEQLRKNTAPSAK